MCGIAGIITDGGEADESQLRRMANLLRHRGPDDTGIYRHEGLGLAHTRLSIIDLAGGHQPLFDSHGNLALIANGEIYNYRELSARLEKRGCRFLTKSDSETILQAYAAYGIDFLRYLHGMFAFALYDKTKQKLILARDRLGIKPLYYLQLPGKVAFASEIKALLPILPQSVAIECVAFAQFLENEFSTGTRTIIHGINRVLPGEVIEIDTGLRLKKTRYWSTLDVPPTNMGFDDAFEQFDALMKQVIQDHLHADVPFGLFLSGGVDSGILAALLSRYHDQPLRTFSVGYRNGDTTGEVERAENIARQFNTVHTTFTLSGSDILNRIPHMIWTTDELMFDTASLPTSILSEHASADVKMVFTGEGGDEVFAGYGRYRRTRLQRLLKTAIAPGSGGFRTHGQWSRSYAQNTFGPDLRDARRSIRIPFINAWQQTPSCWSAIQRSQYTDLTTSLPDNLLVKVDRMLMGFAIEGRVPYLDHRIVEFGLSLPDRLKVHSGQGKMFLKRWAEQYIPKDHLYRKKSGFGVPLSSWLRGTLLEQIGQKLLANRAITEWFDCRGVKQLIADQHKHRGATKEIMNLVHFAVWHRLFIEQSVEKPSPNENFLDWIA